MTDRNDDWGDMSQAWTQETAGDDAGLVALARQVRRRDLWAQLNFFIEIASAIAAGGVIAWMGIARGTGLPVVLIGLVFGAFCLALSIWARRQVGVIETGTPALAVQSALRQARAGQAWAIVGMVVTIATGAALAAFFSLDPPPPGRGPLTATLTIAALAACLVGYGLHLRRCRRRITVHAATLATLERDE